MSQVDYSHNKNYVILAFNYMLKNSKGIISILEISRRYRNNNIKRSEFIKPLKGLL